MTGNEFKKKLKEHGKDNGVTVTFDKKHGKGSHSTICYGDKCTTIKDGKKEIGIGLKNAMLKQLGLDPATF